MARSGIVELLGLAAAVAIATPLAVFGLGELLDGRTVGVAFLGLAVLLVAVEQLLSTPTDVTERALETVVGRVVEEPDED